MTFALTADERRRALEKLLLDAARGEADPLPCSYGQEKRWALSRSAPGAPLDNMSFAWRIRAPLDRAALERAFRAIVRGSEALRTSFSEDGHRLLRVVTDAVEPSLQRHDVRGLAPHAIARAMWEATSVPFDLGRPPLIRMHIFERAEDEHSVLMTAHHIVVDFWSLGIVLPWLGKAYAAELLGQGPWVPPSAPPYAEYVRWQTKRVVGERGDAALRFWEGRLGGGLDHVALPYDRAPPSKRGHQDAVHGFDLDAEVIAGVERVGADVGCTLFAVLHAAFQVVLFSYSGQRRITMVSPSMGRALSSIRDTVGEFANHIPITSELAPNTAFTDLVRHVGAETNHAMEHADFPFAVLSSRIAVRGVPEGGARLPVKFNLPRAHVLKPRRGEDGRPAIAIGPFEVGLELVDRRVTGTCDLHLGLIETDAGFVCSMQYNAEVFDASTVDELCARYRRLLEGLTAGPKTIEGLARAAQA